ncbi:replication protein [Salimicrobium album]|uniref:Phage replication protein O n=1 Tax=Salimicrobium album TaxID=50717 RepID=A0A1H3D7V7_9BACI|nr:replication protein [Salimicrobium album]SDX61769.1 phage replication protein O [Salimicrobium album]
MANPQVEEGYVKIANELLDEIPKYKFNGTQFKLIMIVWRYTYGFNRKSHSLSLSFISKLAGIDKSSVKKQLNQLIDSNVLYVAKEATFNQPRAIGFNKNFEEWSIEKNGSKPPQGEESTLGVNNPTPQGADLPSLQGGNYTPKKYNIKNKYKDSNTTTSAHKIKNESDVGTPETVTNEIASGKLVKAYLDFNQKMNPNAKDYEAAKEIIGYGVPVDDAIQYLKECIDLFNQNRKHRRQKINGLNYCVGFILDKHYEQKEEAKDAKHPGSTQKPRTSKTYRSGKGASAAELERRRAQAEQAFGYS